MKKQELKRQIYEDRTRHAYENLDNKFKMTLKRQQEELNKRQKVPFFQYVLKPIRKLKRIDKERLKKEINILKWYGARSLKASSPALEMLLENIMSLWKQISKLQSLNPQMTELE